MPGLAPHSRLIMAIPYPGRGHINPMMNFCEHLVSKSEGGVLRIVFIVTEEWLSLLSSKESGGNNPDDNKISFLTIPNVLPSERVRGSDHTGFVEAVLRKMEGPVEQVLDDRFQGQQRPDMIIADTFLCWAVDLGARKKIPVASFWPMAASVLSVFYHHNLITESQFYPLDDQPSDNKGQERITHIPGIASIRLEDLPRIFKANAKEILKLVIEVVSRVSKAQFLIFRTIEELEEPAIEALRTVLPQPIYSVGPAIPYFKTLPDSSSEPNDPDYIKWLNRQPARSVLYVSLGSYLSTSEAQLEELVAGLRDSGIPILWVAREEAGRLSTALGEKKGMVISWCDQTRVLIHPSVGGFLTHCGWNSTLESAITGVPALTFPLGADQPQNGKMMVEDWGTGCRLRRNAAARGLVAKDEVCEAVKSFMDLRRDGRKLLDKNCQTLREKLLQSVDEDGTTSDLQEFLYELLGSQ